MEGCPYCRNARRAVQELAAENSAYGRIPLEWIDENKQSNLASQYDYYYVPSIFSGKEKLYEATPGESFEQCKQSIRAIFDHSL